MFAVALPLIGILILLLVRCPSHAQQAEAPVYKDGDWWRVKVDISRPAGVSVSGPALERFPEYVVQFESGQTKVLGVKGNESKETNSPIVLALVLGRSAWRGDLLRFPLRVGLSWSDRVKFQPPGMQMRWGDARYEVQAWQKMKTVKGEFDAFRIVMAMSVPRGPKPQAAAEPRVQTYFYAPELKAIISFQELGSDVSLTSTLVDFNLAP